MFQTVTDETGRRTSAGQGLTQISDEHRPIVGRIVDDLDRWLSSDADVAGRPTDGRGEHAPRP